MNQFESTGLAQVHTGAGVSIYAAITVKHALLLYANTGMKVNRDYTPTRMLDFVERTTGKRFRFGQYAEAAQALKEWSDEARKREMEGEEHGNTVD